MSCSKNDDGPLLKKEKYILLVSHSLMLLIRSFYELSEIMLNNIVVILLCLVATLID